MTTTDNRQNEANPTQGSNLEQIGGDTQPMPPERRRFRLACRMLRQAGYLDAELPDQRPGESPIDWLVRLGLASSPQVAAEMLILGRGLSEVLDQLAADPEVNI